MLKSKKRKIMNIFWIMTDIIVIICAILLLMQGDTASTIIATLGIILVAVETVIFYKRGTIF